VRAIMARAGIAYSLDLLPWRRAYTLTLEHADACLFVTTRTPEREALFKWVGPIDQGDWVLFGRADRTYRLRTLEDARGLRIGTYHGDARDEYLRSRGFRVDAAPDDLTNAPKLLLNRIDLWAGSIKRGSTLLERNGWSRQIVPLLVFKRIQVYLACNKAVPDALIEQMGAALGAMERDGTLRRLDQKYENWRPAQAPAGH